ncbi:MAG: tannase/feruloyl esterase family alpha/beta hydrolase [Candidatus Solibacter usitatus]|nr:tannase/feruloyl esterase family alpha/beta hydrolase [Candidatus Solibacter usitatus]
MLLFLLAVTTQYGAAQPKPLYGEAAPVISCDELKGARPVIAGAEVRVESAVREEASCSVTAVVMHPPAGDRIQVFVRLPLKNWNGRFQGNGGGGFTGGGPQSLNGPAAAGYATASTDAGHAGGSGAFALDAEGRLNWRAIRNFGHVGIHEMTMVGKALAEQFYGKAPRYAYFNGCSTGGRQGLMEVQRYPADYDGVFSGAPAINWEKLHVAQMWGQLVMKEANHYPAPCKFAAANAAAIAACDRADGIADGVIDEPLRCRFDVKSLIGTKPEGCETFSAADAPVVAAIWEGPRRVDGGFLWYGLPMGADFGGLNATNASAPSGRPMGITLDWWKFFLAQNPRFDWTTLTRGAFEQFFDQSVEQFHDVIGTGNADLSGFRARRGKAILWHGWADPLIPAQGTIDYYRRVSERMGANTAEFLRFFLAPGVAHCGGGAGAAPLGQFEALRAWVEEGVAPTMLRAIRLEGGRQGGKPIRAHSLCQYPQVAKYKGSGAMEDDANFSCVVPR